MNKVTGSRLHAIELDVFGPDRSGNGRFAAGEDKLDLREVVGVTFESLMSNAKMVGADTVPDVGNGEHTTLLGADVASLQATDFLSVA